MTDADFARLELKLDHIISLLDPDTARLIRLIPAIAEEVEGRKFQTGDLNGFVDFGGLSANQVGKLLLRNVGRTVAGYRIDVLPKSRSVREWSLTPIGGPQHRGDDAPSKPRE